METNLSERQRDILNLLRSDGRVSVDDLVQHFNVTPQTIRKDLNTLHDQKLVVRTHGGATVSSGTANASYEARRVLQAQEKRLIGIAAAQLVPDNASLFINIGTTTEEVARALQGRDGLLIITNILNVAIQLYGEPGIEVVVAGGPVRRFDGAVVGAAAVDLISQFKVDFAIIGASAIDEDGALLDFDYREVRVARAIIENARKVILVADGSKFGRAAPVRIAHVSDVDVFVTDAPPPPDMQEVLAANSVEVIAAGHSAPIAPGELVR